MPSATRATCLFPLLVILLVTATATVAMAQVTENLRPSEERPQLPDFREPIDEEALSLELPPVPEEPGSLGDLVVRVEGFEIVGSSVFEQAELAAAVAPYVGRTLTSTELIASRDAITDLYHQRGYVTSGALIPDQDVVDGIVRLQVIEGALTEVIVTGNQRFRKGVFERRLLRAVAAPVQLATLEGALQVLQQDRWIAQIEAVLEPGEALGESRLRLVVTEASQQHLQLRGDNDRSPALEEWGGGAHASVANLAGIGDVVSASYEQSEGLLDVWGGLQVPITPWDTRLGLRARYQKTEIVDGPFSSLDIESESQTYEISISHPLYRDAADSIWLGLIGERKRTESSVLGVSFCFEPIDIDCDDPTVTALRLQVDWTRRTESDVFALRSLLSFGLDALDATTVGDASVADGRFVAWLAQAQWAHVLPEELLGTQLVVRGDAQLSDDPLLSVERFAIGGRQSVRGYRENQVVTDSGIVISGELRIPLWRDPLRRPVLEVVPFMDFGHGWNKGPDPEDPTLASGGIGLRFMPFESVLAEAHWGGRLTDVASREDGAQDEGFHLRLVIDAF